MTVLKNPITCPRCGGFVGYQEDFMYYVGDIICPKCGANLSGGKPTW